MRRALAISWLAWWVAAPAAAQGTRLETLAAVHEACAEPHGAEQPRLFAIDVEAGWRFGPTREGLLRVDTGRNFRALDGHVAVLVPREERLGFEVADEAADARLRTASGRLRVGFFLGFDDTSRQPCLVRNRFAVTIVRADVAYVELYDEAGERLARGETDRLRAWNETRAATAIPGEGPRAAVDAARFANGIAPPPGWQTALAADAARQAMGRCHADGIARGAAREGRVVVRLNVETRTGRVRRADVALSSLGDDQVAECVARALGASASLPAGPSSWQAEVVDLSVPVRLVAD
ncbi:MAG: hypothetical protein KF729_29670 [Sandaracinaceae bacterium]|nr:hypothetical protein [Sandaracinaceae bacterium]